ncbi:esterase-like activity of phytase family protein [Tranquillimonas alkanivorans]|uniref:Phytase-like domain-containing protein n=1 Tax=Tranquillimonas alkanivorans TaxID=441119 RepID=A0A1I5L5X9_9RHOB|nr:esterase-like activity of phytase family protein [Tranquillimonas alkanivorans]SFO92582.1 hypothetical protein SAMN04488047_101478 [Tranquillimonas alkanivorans]
MQRRSFAALTAALLIAGCASALPADVRFLGDFDWDMRDDRHGGYSGLELGEDGRRFLAISDRGWIVDGRLEREDGRIATVLADRPQRLKGLSGQGIKKDFEDAEGLAVASDGRIFISFEGEHRVWSYASPGAVPEALARHPDFAAMQQNSSLEALAVGPDGALYTLPERSGALARPFPVYRYADGRWTQPFEIPRRGELLPVGMDLGPDGRLYLLERHFAGIFGFSSRVRRFTLDGGDIVEEETLLETASAQHDNLEGISVWRDGGGRLRLTMISDDNFTALQSTEIVEYVVPD